jgi:hypothetical protein
MGQTIDLGGFSWEDWLLIGIGGMAAVYMMFPDSGAFNPGRKKKKSKSSGTFMGSAAGIIIILGVAYVGYSYLTTQAAS